MYVLHRGEFISADDDDVEPLAKKPRHNREEEEDEDRDEDEQENLVLEREERRSLGGEKRKVPPLRLMNINSNQPSLSNSDVGALCHECGESLTELDIKTKNPLVPCMDHKVHVYCKNFCISKH